MTVDSGLLLFGPSCISTGVQLHCRHSRRYTATTATSNMYCRQLYCRQNDVTLTPCIRGDHDIRIQTRCQNVFIYFQYQAQGPWHHDKRLNTDKNMHTIATSMKV